MIPPTENFNGGPIRCDLAGFAFDKQPPDPTVAKLQNRGELFRLFSESERLAIGIQLLNFGENGDDMNSKRIAYIPTGFANTILLTVFNSWAQYNPNP